MPSLDQIDELTHRLIQLHPGMMNPRWNQPKRLCRRRHELPALAMFGCGPVHAREVSHKRQDVALDNAANPPLAVLSVCSCVCLFLGMF